jgi:hypothetical protein
MYVFIYSETFANKNNHTILEVNGHILGIDLLDHPGTFDYVSTD